MIMRKIGWVAALAAMMGIGVMASAHAGAPEAWQLGFQTPASTSKADIHWLHDWLLVLITLISLFVLGLLIYTMLRFRAERNPTPTRLSHNTTLEVAWTVIPVVILVILAIPSFRLMYKLDRTAAPDMTIKVVGHQWYWSYEYPDNGFTFDSYMVQDEDLKPGQKRLLEVDNRIVLPVDTNIRILIAGTDVIHSWFVPALGVQTYAMPGRLNETWVRITKPGVYYGQCNQICGINHAYMPIAVEAVSKDAYQRWTTEAKRQFAKVQDAPVVVAEQTPAR